jgi:cytoskeletal protein CcmA (bactofilin family)
MAHRTDAPRFGMKVNMAGTVIGEGLTVEGEFSSDDEVVVFGSLRGTLSSGSTISVGGTGTVEADVKAQSLSVAGQVTGNVISQDRVDIQTGGRLIGDVKASRLTIADGASFKGNVDMDV